MKKTIYVHFIQRPFTEVAEKIAEQQAKFDFEIGSAVVRQWADGCLSYISLEPVPLLKGPDELHMSECAQIEVNETNPFSAVVWRRSNKQNRILVYDGQKMCKRYRCHRVEQ